MMQHAMMRAEAAPGASSRRQAAQQQQQQRLRAAAGRSSQGVSELLLALLLALLLGTGGASASAQQQQQQEAPSAAPRLTSPYAPGTSPTQLGKNLTVRSSHTIPSTVHKATNISHTVNVTGSREVRLTAPRVNVDFRGSNNTHLDATDSDVFDVSDDEAYDVVGTGNSKVAAGEMDDLQSVFPNGSITRSVAKGGPLQGGGGAAPFVDPAPIPPTNMSTSWNVRAKFNVPSTIGSSIVLYDHTHVQDARAVLVEGADVRVASDTSGNTGFFVNDSDLADVADNGGTTGLATGNAIVLTGEVEAPGETAAAMEAHSEAEKEAEAAAEVDAEAAAEEAEDKAQKQEEKAKEKQQSGSGRHAATPAAAAHARRFDNHVHPHDGQRGRPRAGGMTAAQSAQVPKFSGRYGPSRRRQFGRRLLWRLLPGITVEAVGHAAVGTSSSNSSGGSNGAGKMQQQRLANGGVVIQQTVQQQQQQQQHDVDVALQLSLNITNAVEVDVSRSVDNTTNAGLGSPRVRLALDAQGNRQVVANGSSLFNLLVSGSSGCTAATASSPPGRPRARAAAGPDAPASTAAAALGELRAGAAAAAQRGPIFQVLMTVINRVSVDARQMVSHSHNVTLAGAAVDVTLSASNITQIEALNATIGNVLQAAPGCGQPAGSSGGQQAPVLLPLPSKVVAAVAAALHSLAGRLAPVVTVLHK